MTLRDWQGTHVLHATALWVTVVGAVWRIVRAPLLAALTDHYVARGATHTQAVREMALGLAVFMALLVGPPLGLWVGWRRAARRACVVPPAA